MTGEPAEKRSIGSLKNSPTHGKKVKRDISYDDLSDDAELLEPVFQNEPLNYDELRYAMNDMYPEYEKEIHSQKRYLGECHWVLHIFIFICFYIFLNIFDGVVANWSCFRIKNQYFCKFTAHHI